MKTSSTIEGRNVERRGERGAALVTTLLVTMLLLAAGGTLAWTTAMSANTAVDATSEVQAYYAAEAGMQAAVNVIRRNAPSIGGATPATFRNIVNDPHLANWIATDTTLGTEQVTSVNLAGSPFSAYSISVIDPDATPAAADPTRLLVHVRGHGPRGSVKEMEMLVNFSPYDLDPPAAITLIGAESGVSMQTSDFNIGDSSPKGYSGDDQAGVRTDKSPFGFTVLADKLIADAVFLSDPKAADSTDDTPGRTVKLNQATDLPLWLRTADAARKFLADNQNIAQTTVDAYGNSRYFTSSPSKDDFGTIDAPAITYVNGDCDYYSATGAGLLIVTGKLTFHGGAVFKGVILLLGQGQLDRNGGGGGGIYGALIEANLNSTAGTGYLAKPAITTSGGGNSEIKYNSVNVRKAFETLGVTVKSVREY